MSTKKQVSASKKINLQVRIFFRRYPASPYILKWLFICSCIGLLVGSASAGFLQSLDWVTNYRENHLWLIALLPVAGLLIGLLYHYLGKAIEPGNNLLIDTIHNPKEIIPSGWRLLCISELWRHIYSVAPQDVKELRYKWQVLLPTNSVNPFD